MISRRSFVCLCVCVISYLDNLVIFARSHKRFSNALFTTWYYDFYFFLLYNFVNQTQKWRDGLNEWFSFFKFYLDLVISRSTTAWTHSSHWIASRISYFLLLLHFVSSSLPTFSVVTSAVWSLLAAVFGISLRSHYYALLSVCPSSLLSYFCFWLWRGLVWFNRLVLRG